jgi:hypothetical protein
MGLLKLKSHKIASLKYLKKKITVWTEAGQKKQVNRYAFVDNKTGSYYVVRLPSLKKKQIAKELSYYVKENQNFKSIQDQLRNTKKKTAKKVEVKKTTKKKN